MKNLLPLFVLLGLAIGVSAQEIVDFSDLPDISSPSPIPDGYGNLIWTGFFYVDPYMWVAPARASSMGRLTSVRTPLDTKHEATMA